AIQHDAVGELGNQDGVVKRIRQNLPLGYISSSGHFASLLHIKMISSVLEALSRFVECLSEVCLYPYIGKRSARRVPCANAQCNSQVRFWFLTGGRMRSVP